MAMLEYVPKTVTIVKITHNLASHTTLVSLNWDDGSNLKLTLPVPFDTPMDAMVEAVTEALEAFTGELGEAPIRPALFSPLTAKRPRRREKVS